MLIGNGRLTDKLPMSFLGRDWNAQMQPGALVASTQTENFGALAAMPDGYYTPQCWMLPRKAGSLSSRNVIEGNGSVVANGLSVLDAIATLLGVGDIEAAGGLIVNLLATISGSGTISTASMQAFLNLLATITGSGGVTASTLTGLGDLIAQIQSEGTITSTATGQGNLGATIRGYGDLTPEGLRDAIWSTLAASFNSAGTMGSKLNTASSGGVDLDALASAVWNHTQ